MNSLTLSKCPPNTPKHVSGRAAAAMASVSLLSSCESRLSKLCAKQASNVLSNVTEFNTTQNDILRMLLDKVEQSHCKELLLDESTLHGDGDVCEQLEEYLKRRAGFTAEEGFLESHRAIQDGCAQHKRELEEGTNEGSNSSKLLDDFAMSSKVEPSLRAPRPEALADNVCAYQLVRGKRAADQSLVWCQGLLQAVSRRRLYIEAGTIGADSPDCGVEAHRLPVADADLERVYALRLLRKAEAEVSQRIGRLLA